MEISHIKLCSLIYYIITGYDKAYIELRKIPAPLDLNKDDHCKHILDFLRKWQCRQFAADKENEKITLKSIESWVEQYQNLLAILNDKDIFAIKNDFIESFQECFINLAESKACVKKNGTATNFGCVGAAKFLFAFRPEIFFPWDNEIIRYYENCDREFNYCTFMIKMKENLNNLKNECEDKEIKLESLKKEIEKSRRILNKTELDFNLTYPKLIDEYNWVTITKKLNIKGTIEVFKSI